MEFVRGAVSGSVAAILTNPLDLVKTRLQLQGELQARQEAVTHYKNTVQALYIISKKEGLMALQKGLVPAVYFQVFLNGVRLGAMELLVEYRLLLSRDLSRISLVKTGLSAAFFGCLGGFLGSPFYLVKIRSQSRAPSEIAVGFQHSNTRLATTLVHIYRNEGLQGLWRGSASSLPRIAVGSAAQIASFSKIKEALETHHILTREKSLWNTFVASMCCGVVVAFFMTPFDVIQTRVYNQGVDKNGKGLLYVGTIDCAIKTYQTEGAMGFFKGIGPCYLRIGPHSMLTLLIWDSLKKYKTPRVH